MTEVQVCQSNMVLFINKGSITWTKPNFDIQTSHYKQMQCYTTTQLSPFKEDPRHKRQYHMTQAQLRKFCYFSIVPTIQYRNQYGPKTKHSRKSKSMGRQNKSIWQCQICLELQVINSSMNTIWHQAGYKPGTISCDDKMSLQHLLTADHQ